MDQFVYLKEEPRGPSELVEIPVNANGLNRIPVPDQPLLRSTANVVVVVKSIRCIVPGVLTGGILQAQNTAPIAELQKMSLTLYAQGWEKGHYIPLLTLNDVQDQTNNPPHRYTQTNFDNWENIAWDKCYLQLAANQVTANSPYVVLLDVCYIKLDQYKNEIKGSS